MSDHKHTSSCFCGEVKFEVSGEPAAMGYCHCESCRHWSAGPVNAFTLWKPEALKITQGASSIAVGPDGAVSYIAAGSTTRTTAGYISLAKFPNESGLQRASGNRWTANAASGTEEIGTPGGDFGSTQSGTLEMSNVDLATEFTNMISAQRGFQANSRVISTADDMLNDLVNLKR